MSQIETVAKVPEQVSPPAPAACVPAYHNVVFADLNDEAGCSEATRQYTEGHQPVACYRGGGCAMYGNTPDATHRSANEHALGACVLSCGQNPKRGVDLLVGNLYTSFFNREPEEAGLAFWRKAYNSNPNFSCIDLVGSITGSAEFKANTANLDSLEFVTKLYKGLLRRNPDLDGLAANIIAYNNLTAAMGMDAGRAALVNAFVGSAEMLVQCHTQGLWQLGEP